jgi:hypothetical protein
VTAFRLAPKGNTHGWPEYAVEVDGHDVSQVLRGVELSVFIADRGTVTLHLGAVPRSQVDLPDAHVRVDDATAALLVRLGWTPPKEITR